MTNSLIFCHNINRKSFARVRLCLPVLKLLLCVFTRLVRWFIGYYLKVDCPAIAVFLEYLRQIAIIFRGSLHCFEQQGTQAQ